jgi:hypothetical protein
MKTPSHQPIASLGDDATTAALLLVPQQKPLRRVAYRPRLTSLPGLIGGS